MDCGMVCRFRSILDNSDPLGFVDVHFLLVQASVPHKNFLLRACNFKE